MGNFCPKITHEQWKDGINAEEEEEDRGRRKRSEIQAMLYIWLLYNGYYLIRVISIWVWFNFGY